MQYCIKSFSNPANRSQVMYYAYPVYTGKITLDDMTEDLAEATSLNPVDVKAVIEGFIANIPKYIAKGNKVFLGNLGIFSLGFKSLGRAKPENVEASDINSVHVMFRSSSLLRKATASKATFTFNGVQSNGTASADQSSGVESQD